MKFRVTDMALLIAAHKHRKQDFDGAVHSVVNECATNLTEDQRALLYTGIVENANPHTSVLDLEDIVRISLRKAMA